MISAPIALLFLIAPPSCSLFEGTEHLRGQPPLTLAGLIATAQDPSAYRLRSADLDVSAQSFGRPLLMSLTWQRPGKPAPATMTCTQKRGGTSQLSQSTPAILCTTREQQHVVGTGHVRFHERKTATDWTVQATQTELRIAVTGPEVGFIAAWRERPPAQFIPLWLEFGTHAVLCLVL